MKRFVFVGVWVATFILLGSGAAVAQQGGGGGGRSKVAYVNTQAILKATPGYASAESTFASGLDALRIKPGVKHPAYAASLLAFASLEVDLGRYTEAEARAEEREGLTLAVSLDYAVERLAGQVVLRNDGRTLRRLKRLSRAERVGA